MSTLTGTTSNIFHALLFLFSIKNFLKIFIWGGTYHMAYGILVPEPLTEPMLPAVEADS